MKNLTLNFLFGILTAVGFLYVINYFVFDVLDTYTSVVIVDNVASPNGEFVATTNRASNNDGWCEERTTIHKMNEKFDWERDYVFNTNCGSTVKLNWKNNKNLEITYSYNDDGFAKTSQQTSTENNEIKISYVFKQ